MSSTTDRPTLPPSYVPSDVEEGRYDWWESRGDFQPGPENGRDAFTIVMPPPNVTGELHIGHALTLGLEDIMVRYHRMRGDPTLWLPGADHAGIAGQWVVEKLIAQEGLTRHDLGREAFEARVWDYMNRYRGRIREQSRILGASCDWSRFLFTMDPGSATAVRKTFKHLYDKGLIYRGDRLISWCPRCNTALSDLEVVHRDVPGHLWHLIYAVDGSDATVTVATSRPETMLGDTAVAVHPDDERYAGLVGRSVRLPLTDRLIPILADTTVDPAFGSGAVKVTPAHDPNDYEIGKRANLPVITVMNQDGTMNANAGDFSGLTIADARTAVVAALEAIGAMGRIEPHTHPVGHCERCGTVVEPLISKQWFVRMEELAKPAIAAANDGSLTFVPERFKGVYLNWLENIRDWCISRQLWWGHRIPVWYRESDGAAIVSEVDLEVDPETGDAVNQDPDVLDTWFSSGLWPMSTLGWPEQTDDLRRFYPTSVMETGYEILFFWVSRMVVLGIETMGEVPFHTVYLHGMVRDVDGLKMSKTKGNVIDPTELSMEYGSDALRFALATQGSPGLDSRLSVQLVESSRNFINKLWNATRFALGAIGEDEIALDAEGPVRPTVPHNLFNRWILSRLDAVTADTTRLLDTHQYGEAGRQLREFAWSELCDWFIEAAKASLKKTGAARDETLATLAFVLERLLKLLHPYAPFATEELWQAVPHTGEALIVASWPDAAVTDAEADRLVGTVIELVTKVRNARSASAVEPGRWIAATVHAGGLAGDVSTLSDELCALARIDREQLTITSDSVGASPSDIVVVAGDLAVVLPLAGMVDLTAERARLEKEQSTAEAEIGRLDRQLNNPSFVERAPATVVEAQRERRQTVTEHLTVIRGRREALTSGD